MVSSSNDYFNSWINRTMLGVSRGEIVNIMLPCLINIICITRDYINESQIRRFIMVSEYPRHHESVFNQPIRMYDVAWGEGCCALHAPL